MPLGRGGFAVGVIARANPKAALLEYFFGPLRSEEVPSLADVAQLKADAVLVRRFSHLGVVEGRWPLLGSTVGWDRRDWPTPVFVRYEELTGRSFRVSMTLMTRTGVSARSDPGAGLRSRYRMR